MSIDVMMESSETVARFALVGGLLPFVILAGWLGVRGPVRDQTEGHASILMITGLAAAMVWLIVPSFIFSLMFGAPTTDPTTAPTTALTTTTTPTTTNPAAQLTGPQRAWLAATVPLVPLALMVGVIYRSRERVIGLGLEARNVGSGSVIGVGMLFVILPLVWAMSELTVALWQWLDLSHPRAHDLLETYRERPEVLTRAVVVFAAVVAAPLFEEFLFRGCLQTALSTAFRRGWPARPALARWTAIILVSLVFALVHSWWMQPIIFALSLAIGWVYERTGNLWTAIAAHAAFNGASTLISIYAAPPME